MTKKSNLRWTPQCLPQSIVPTITVMYAWVCVCVFAKVPNRGPVRVHGRGPEDLWVTEDRNTGPRIFLAHNDLKCGI